MVYMAYKDLYQVSNTEVTSHCCVVWGIWMGFLLLLGPWLLSISHCGPSGRLLGHSAS